MADRRRRWLTGALAAVVMGAVAFGLFWAFYLRAPVEPELTLPVAAVTETTGVAETTGVTETTGVAENTAVTGTAADPVGTWTVSTGSSAGYRVDEEFTVGGRKTAVGRTSDVAGTVVVTPAGDGFTAAADITVDLTTLASDSGRRDGVIKRRGLETDRFPRGSFAATGIAVPATAAAGRFDATVTGKLTLHGVTRDVTVTLAAQLSGGQLQILGSAPVVMADFDIDPPNVPGAVSVDDNGTFEFLLLMSRG